jgi:GAF domain-containing protein
MEVRSGVGLSGWVAEHGKAIVNGNPGVESAYPLDPARLGKLRSALAVPLITDLGIAGVLSLYRTENDAFTNANLATLTALSSVVANAVALAQGPPDAAPTPEEHPSSRDSAAMTCACSSKE